MRRVVSIDIGIKNLALCVFDVVSSRQCEDEDVVVTVVDWCKVDLESSSSPSNDDNGGGGGGGTDFVRLGRNMKTHFDAIFHDPDEVRMISHVAIENQISRISTKMKTIQGMVMQYFIMRCQVVVIDFVSSSNKLKEYYRQKNKVAKESSVTTTTTPTTDKAVYKKHKRDGILYCLELFSDVTTKPTLQHHHEDNILAGMRRVATGERGSGGGGGGGGGGIRKWDDYADCFLQGWWYIVTCLGKKAAAVAAAAASTSTLDAKKKTKRSKKE